jgi:hypothetical protein
MAGIATRGSTTAPGYFHSLSPPELSDQPDLLDGMSLPFFVIHYPWAGMRHWNQIRHIRHNWFD